MVLYGVFNIVLGVEAFVAKGSVVSLIAAGTAGVLVLVAVALTKNYPRAGYILAALVCVGLIGRFLPAFLKDTTNLYPALTVTLASLLVLVALVGSHFAAMSRRRSSPS
jgi:uncharacterized membrane protein (UPF0136 family)